MWVRTQVDRVKEHTLIIYATETDIEWASFCHVDYHPKHTLVGGVSVNSLYQQGGLFAHSVNIHSITLKHAPTNNSSISSSIKQILNLNMSDHCIDMLTDIYVIDSMLQKQL